MERQGGVHAWKSCQSVVLLLNYKLFMNSLIIVIFIPFYLSIYLVCSFFFFEMHAGTHRPFLSIHDASLATHVQHPVSTCQRQCPQRFWSINTAPQGKHASPPLQLSTLTHAGNGWLGDSLRWPLSFFFFFLFHGSRLLAPRGFVATAHYWASGKAFWYLVKRVYSLGGSECYCENFMSSGKYFDFFVCLCVFTH